jgi:catechol 2,3-dioxygenase-like lactoylglutathione lyase family enzyme
MAIAAQRIIHVNLNVHSLAEALAFFTAGAGLRVMAQSRAEPQPGAAMGIEGMVQWHGNSIHGAGSRHETTIDLLEWQQPETRGRAYPQPWHTGLSRLAIRTPDLPAAYARLSAQGVRCFTQPVTGAVSGERFFCCALADGAVVQLLESHAEPALHYVNINCSNLSRSSQWYQRVLGFEPESDIWDETLPGEVFGVPGPVHTRSQRLTLVDRETDCIVQLQQWLQPGGCGQPYPCANHAGYYRLALAVADVADCYRQLRAADVDCPQPPGYLHRGTAMPGDGVRVLFFYDPDGICLELVQHPTEVGI